MSSIANLLKQLVAIDSVNSSLVAGAAGEAEIAQFVAEWLASAGLSVEVVEPVLGHPSVLAHLRGAGSGPTLLLYAHMDTVGVTGMSRPHDPVIRDGRLYGRGAYDMKGGLAAIMSAAAELAAGPQLPGDIWLMAVADEEYGSMGATAALARLAELGVSIDEAIVTEPTDLQIGVAHRGFGCATITTHGRAAHTSRRGEGIDAIAHMGRVVVAIEQLDQTLQQRAPHPLLGHGAVLASLIAGGNELFTYPAQCQIELVRRTLPGESAATMAAELELLLAKQRAADPRFSATLHMQLYRPPLETPADAPIVVALDAAAQSTLGHRPILVGASFWTDAALIAATGAVVVIFGPCGAGLHSDEEWVELESVQACADTLVATARMR